MIVRMLWIPILFAAACSSVIPRKMPDEPPPLADMEEPIALFTEPDDEAERLALDHGGYTGIDVKPAYLTLDDEGDPAGLLITRVVENSPADAAGLAEDDVVLAVVLPDGSEEVVVWPSEWRKLELTTPPGTELTVIFDRAGVESEVTLRVIPRVRPADRREASRFREEDRVGVVVRTATEVEARSAGLGPGGGAVVVGLALVSPWRRAGIRYGDLVVVVGGLPVDHPQVVMDAIREGDETIDVVYVRDGRKVDVTTALTRREREVTHVEIPLLFEYESDRGSTETSVLFGMVNHKTTPSAWSWRILWLIRFGGGDADLLEEVENP